MYSRVHSNEKMHDLSIYKEQSLDPLLCLAPDPSFPLLQLREASERASVPAGGAGGLSRLRWPQGHCQVTEIVGLLPTGVGWVVA